MRLLIVDDSATMRKIIMRGIRQSGLNVDEFLEAGNGKEALQVLSSNGGVDVILTDVNMPEMNGLELLEALKSSGETKDIPVVMITTEGSEAVVEKAKQLGVSGFIRKPFTPETLSSTLSSVMG
ncbi:MAG: response regulator [Deltaproteobacteria bacterium]|nr:MAG: response regulator [Deltaproteobacteria bacterium]